MRVGGWGKGVDEGYRIFSQLGASLYQGVYSMFNPDVLELTKRAYKF